MLEPGVACKLFAGVDVWTVSTIFRLTLMARRCNGDDVDGVTAAGRASLGVSGDHDTLLVMGVEDTGSRWNIRTTSWLGQ